MPQIRPSVKVAMLTEDPTSMASGDTAAICGIDCESAAVVTPNVEAAADPVVMKQPASWMSTKTIAAAAAKIATGKKQLLERNAIDAVKVQNSRTTKRPSTL
eukprot:CAMPEP_0172816374 /NCGR_PEP_ID=MMETSP1075-20121228/12420_1 /TAXON_ID=2916 /ORGANISM="Ceratium fusus, Strain PA161109" /LENGTH=101 /DNA_ID=CAMNT_0013656355 /DNA_START=134 /DNA_END=435 /DNA_ORIENTATION=+